MMCERHFHERIPDELRCDAVRCAAGHLRELRDEGRVLGAEARYLRGQRRVLRAEVPVPAPRDLVPSGAHLKSTESADTAYAHAP